MCVWCYSTGVPSQYRLQTGSKYIIKPLLLYYKLNPCFATRLESSRKGVISLHTELAGMSWIEINDSPVAPSVSGLWLDLQRLVNSSGVIHYVFLCTAPQEPPSRAGDQIRSKVFCFFFCFLKVIFQLLIKWVIKCRHTCTFTWERTLGQIPRSLTEAIC